MSGEDESDAPDGAEAPGGAAPAPAPEEDDAPDEQVDGDSDYGPPFVHKTFGGALVWARGESFVATVLRVKEGKSVPVATQNRRDMTVMLTGGRAVLEVTAGGEVDRVELLPASAVVIDPGNTYRLIALTEVELFTVYSPSAGP